MPPRSIDCVVCAGDRWFPVPPCSIDCESVRSGAVISFGVKTPAIHSGDIDTALLERTKHRKIHLTFGLKCSIIRVSSWQTFVALPLGNVSAYPLQRG